MSVLSCLSCRTECQCRFIIAVWAPYFLVGDAGPDYLSVQLTPDDVVLECRWDLMGWGPELTTRKNSWDIFFEGGGVSAPGGWWIQLWSFHSLRYDLRYEVKVARKFSKKDSNGARQTKWLLFHFQITAFCIGPLQHGTHKAKTSHQGSKSWKFEKTWC